MGKSAISLYLALQQMIQHKLPVIIFSLEMTKHQMEYRLWSLMSRMDCYQHLGLTPINGDRIRQHRAGLSCLTEKEKDLEKLYSIKQFSSLNQLRGRELSLSPMKSINKTRFCRIH